eukprot:4526830-Pleurochrysis_carterae.AAC.1
MRAHDSRVLGICAYAQRMYSRKAQSGNAQCRRSPNSSHKLDPEPKPVTHARPRCAGSTRCEACRDETLPELLTHGAFQTCLGM